MAVVVYECVAELEGDGLSDNVSSSEPVKVTLPLEEMECVFDIDVVAVALLEVVSVHDREQDSDRD